MKHETYVNNEKFKYTRWGSAFSGGVGRSPEELVEEFRKRVQDRYTFKIGGKTIVLSVIQGVGTYGNEPGQEREIALWEEDSRGRMDDWLTPQQLGIRGFAEYWRGDDVAGHVPVDDVFVLIERLRKKERTV